MKAEAFVCIPHVKDKGTAVDVEILPLVLCKDCTEWDKTRYNKEMDRAPCLLLEMEVFTSPCFFCAAGITEERGKE